MNLFDGYCYATIDEAAIEEISRPVVGQPGGVFAPSSYSVTSATTVDLTIRSRALTDTSSKTFVFTRVYPTCAEVGYQPRRYTDLADIYAQYFDVDLAIVELVMGAYFVAFVSGHVLGRIVSGLRKAG